MFPSLRWGVSKLEVWCSKLEMGCLQALGEVFPSLAIIITINKGGSRTNPAHFRPVSLKSHTIKTFERVIRKDVVKFLASAMTIGRLLSK